MKLLTLNVHGFNQEFGPWEKRREVISRGMQRLGVEVVALQNVWRREGDGDQVSQLAALVPSLRHHSFIALSERVGPVQGMGLMSQLPIDPLCEHRLAASRSREDPSPRAIVYTAVQGPLGRVTIFNCHFSWVEDENKANCEEALLLFRKVEGAKIVAGDFNSPAHGRLGQQFKADGWIDPWAALNDGEPGLTFPAGEPVKRIDHFWVSKELERPLRATKVVFEEPVEPNVYASEHLGVFLDIAL